MQNSNRFQLNFTNCHALFDFCAMHLALPRLHEEKSSYNVMIASYNIFNRIANSD